MSEITVECSQQSFQQSPTQSIHEASCELQLFAAKTVVCDVTDDMLKNTCWEPEYCLGILQTTKEAQVEI